MKLSLQLRIGLWLLIIVNLIMSFGAIAVFLRMTPAIETILEKNDQSLRATEEMLAALANISSNLNENEKHRVKFTLSLERAKRNVTEMEEPLAIERIESVFLFAFSGDIEKKRICIEELMRLASINRQAMSEADMRARVLGNAGAWWIVILAICSFGAALFLVRRKQNELIESLEEIHEVILAQKKGDKMRRCVGSGLSGELRSTYQGINDFIDLKNQSLKH